MKTYIFASYTDFASGRLTGAHRRFLEYMHYAAQHNHVVFVGTAGSEKVLQSKNITLYEIDSFLPSQKLPQHIAGGYAIYRTLKKHIRTLSYDYAVSFNPVITIAYDCAGLQHIVSLFREDLIGYQRALQSSGKKLLYFQMQERWAAKVSEKIIVQCENDRKNLIARNEKYCKNFARKVYIQINNANASWMKSEFQEHPVCNDIPKILFIGNFSDRRKGHFLLLPAAMRLLNEGYKFELLCVGGGRELEQCAKDCEAFPAIRFPGQVTDMGEYLRQADMMFVPSLIDSCPNTVLEGLNAGIAVYGAATGGIPDLLLEKEYMFDTEEESIYAFLKEILETGRYKEDSVKQRKRKESLCFNWGEKISEIIEMK